MSRTSALGTKERREFACSVGKTIRRIRQSRNLLIVDVADDTGLSRPFIAAIERGEAGISLFVAVQIAECLEVSVNDFL